MTEAAEKGELKPETLARAMHITGADAVIEQALRYVGRLC